ncbi:DNA-binding response regulator, OmpR family, contains REC and winged-helix (wHTH) domain [Oscillospiraceae bacterium]|nr:DNA-binding response regulator, OmpR family, contains REC and winged-helix (wHTH) domain [Oscillospiraceae bacterium]
MKDILIVEDNEELGALMRDFLTREGYTVTWKMTGEEGILALKEDKFRLMLLDVMLPGFDGYETLRIIRKELGLPVLMMSARNDDQSKILGLDVGADDYVEKPFSMPVLLSKIKAILRRNYDMAQERKELSYDDIHIDLDDMTVRKGDRVIPVNGKELDILIYFLKNPDKAIRKEALFDAVWGSDCMTEISTLAVYIRWLREKIEDDPKNPKYIHTIWRVGYRFGLVNK